ncbi:MAG: phosphoglycerate kinase, partial [Candidatus Falkowbacteria bacterium]|nr:phosphoglycerate kinase [Candidatus Falkowbacteria bacterium]
MAIKSLKNLKNLKNKTVWLRVDFNVPTKKGKIIEDYKISDSLATINFLLAKKCKLIIATHWGEPGGRRVAEYSTKPLAVRLQKLLGKPVKFVPALVGAAVKAALKDLASGEILFLENLRFAPGELSNSQSFAKKLSQGADLYVNDAFAVSHRAQASLSAIKKYLPSYAGLLLEQEVMSLSKILRPQPPLVVILGGSKISTKLPLISRLYKIADSIILGGGLANNFFKFQKFNIGQSIFEAGVDKEIKKFFKGGRLDPKIILPIDVVVGRKDKNPQVKNLGAIKDKEAILDIGPDSISLFATYIKNAKTIVWNGP